MGSNTSVLVGNKTLITNSYGSLTGNLTKATYDNGAILEPKYDSIERVIEKKYNGVTKFTWDFGADGRIGNHQDNVNNLKWRYEYDLAKRITAVTSSDTTKLNYSYDDKGNMSKLLLYKGGLLLSQGIYTYGNDNRITSAAFDSTSITRIYDNLGRQQQRDVNITAGGKWTTGYTFLAGTGGSTTTALVNSVSQTKVVSGITTPMGTTSYTYDNKGNILTITEGALQKVKYTYDELNQLIREDNANIGVNKTITYTYDTNGNILLKTDYALTTVLLQK